MDITSNAIYIENFPLDTNENLLRKLFSHFGKIQKIDLPTFESSHPICRGLVNPKTKGFAFIEFTNTDSSDKACRFFNDIDLILRECRHSKQAHKRVKLDGDQLTKAIFENLEFEKLLSMRIMPKGMHKDLTQKYKEARYQSMIRAAHLLVVT